MLTPEEKQRIEDDERKRIAEEQYRMEVRGKLRPKPNRSTLNVLLALAIALILVLSFRFAAQRYLGWHSNPKPKHDPLDFSRDSASVSPQQDSANADAFNAWKANSVAANAPAPQATTHWVPDGQQIYSGQVVVPARGYVHYRIQVLPKMYQAHVTGRFSASGGRGNDVRAVLTTENEFDNWINGHQAQVFYGTGQETNGTFDVGRLAPGTYVFAVSNKFGMVSPKYVMLDLKLTYQREKTY